MTARASTAETGRVLERRRAVALAHHYREFEGFSIRQIADRLGRSPATIKAYFYDPTGEKARAVKARYVGVCRGCGAYTQPRNGKGDAYAYCKACHPRHQQRCRVHDGSRCNCKPSYYGVAYDRVQRKPVRTRRHPTVDGAKNARSDLQATLDRGEAPAARGPRLTEARTHFVTAAREGRALNKHGRRYKTTAIDVFEGRLRHDIEPRLGRRRITDIRRGEVQAIIDELAPVASGSSVRGVVNSLRALYTWAEDRDLVNHNPAARVKLPAMNASPIERVASPAEFARLLAALDTVDALAYALAGYAMARAEQIRRARWRDVDLSVGAVELGVDANARKSAAARRVVPAVPPLHALLRRAYLEAGRPDGSALLCPPRYRARKSGLLSTNGLAKRARKRWQAAKLEPITLQECRHTAATWLDAAGVSPRIASSWATRHRRGRRAPRQSHSPGTPTRSRTTSSGPATS